MENADPKFVRPLFIARSSFRVLPIEISVPSLSHENRVVITGIGLYTSIGRSREAVWQAVQRGESGVRRLTGIAGIPDGLLLGTTADVEAEFAERTGRDLKAVRATLFDFQIRNGAYEPVVLAQE